MLCQVCDSVIKKETMFKQVNVEEHTAAVIEETLKRLADQRKPFKYVGESDAVELRRAEHCDSDLRNHTASRDGYSHGNLHPLGS